MGKGVVVRDEVTRKGQHWLEVLLTAKPATIDEWVERAPQCSYDEARGFVREEKDMGTWRLYVRWPAREMVKIDKQTAVRFGIVKTEGVLWCIGTGQSVREAIWNAAAEYWYSTGRQARAAWLWKMPAGAPARLPLAEEPEVELELKAAAWVPKGYVMVTE